MGNMISGSFAAGDLGEHERGTPDPGRPGAVVAPVPRPPRITSRARRRGLGILVSVLLAAGVQLAYFALLRCFDVASVPFTANYGDVPAGARGVRVEVDAMSVDVTARVIRLRVGVHSVSGATRSEPGTHVVLPRDRAAHAATTVILVAGGEARTITGPLPQFLVLSANLTEGGNAAYPFDGQGTDLSVSAVGSDAAEQEVSGPVSLSFRDALAAYDVRPVRSEVAPGSIGIGLGIRRNLTSVIFSCCFYGIMVVIAAATLLVGILCALRLRKTELPMTTLFATSLFAVPALRNSMPGAPPLGVRADFLVFLWAELGIAAGLLLFLTGWFRNGTRPLQAAEAGVSAALPAPAAAAHP